MLPSRTSPVSSWPCRMPLPSCAGRWFVRERFLEYTLNSAPAPRELAILYSRFLARLQQLNWTDMEGQSWLAIDALEGNPSAAAHIQLVVVDGFTNFTGARLQFLKLLAKQSGKMLITLPGQLDSTRPVHRRSRQVFETLMRELSPQVVELTTTPHLPPESLHLQAHVLDPGNYRKMVTLSPLLVETRSPSEEAREALRWIKGLHVRSGVPLASCAVYAASLETYQPLLRTAADEFGLRVHFSYPDSLAESPSVLALLTLLGLPIEDYQTRSLFKALRSPYFDFGLEPADVENLEKVARQAVIVFGREQWQKAWERLMRISSPSENDLDEEWRGENLIAGIDLPSLRGAFAPFWDLFNGITTVQSTTAWSAWLEQLLEMLHFYDRITSRRDREACRSLEEALRALVLSESVAGVKNNTYAQFIADLRGALNGARLLEPAESRQDAVLIGRILEARASRFKAVALLGLSEGQFPVVENPDPFLDEQLRGDLGLEPRLDRQQASIFYQAFTRADEHLLLTRPYLSEEGEAWEPSPYWLAAQKLFADQALQRIKPAAVRTQADAASPQELLFWAIQQDSLQYCYDEDLAARWQGLEKANQILTSRRTKVGRSPYEGSLENLRSELSARYSPHQAWSASRLEDYGTCPYKFFISTVLNLKVKQPPELGLNAAQVGSIYHRILELTYREAGTDTGVQDLLVILEHVAAGVFRTAPDIYGFRPSPLWQVEMGQYIETLRQTIQMLEEHSRGWSPLRFEQKFGICGTPELELDLETERIHLHGIIDRVDRHTDGHIRVIDYKTGGSHMAKADFTEGRRLQLPVYALAASQALCLGEVSDGFYWIINQAQASSFRLSTYARDDIKGPPVAYAVLAAHLQRILAGIRGGDFRPQPPRGGCPDYCPAVQWCWRYQAGF